MEKKIDELNFEKDYQQLINEQTDHDEKVMRFFLLGSMLSDLKPEQYIEYKALYQYMKERL